MYSLSFTFLSLLSLTSALPYYNPGQPACLTDADTKHIVQDWTAVWSNDLSKLNGVAAPNIKIYEEDATNGKPVPQFANRASFRKFLSTAFDPATNDFVVKKEFPKFYFHDCDQIALRWEVYATTTGIHRAETGVRAGHRFQAKGTDLIKVDLYTKQIVRVDTSQDNLVFNSNIGYTEQPQKHA